MSDHPRTTGTAVRLREGLRTLRESGSFILVVGRVPTSVSANVCAEMGGRTQTKQVLVETGCGCASTAHVGDPDVDVRRVRWECASRGTTTASPTGDGSSGDGPVGTSRPVTPGSEAETGVESTAVESVTELGDVVSREVASVADGERPGSLRLCMDSPIPMVEAASERAVFRALHVLGTVVREHRGIGHVHLPMDRRAELVRVLEPLFDVTVELETFSDEARQRWYLHDEGLTSDWLPVEGAGGRA